MFFLLCRLQPWRQISCIKVVDFELHIYLEHLYDCEQVFIVVHAVLVLQASQCLDIAFLEILLILPPEWNQQVRKSNKHSSNANFKFLTQIKLFRICLENTSIRSHKRTLRKSWWLPTGIQRSYRNKGKRNNAHILVIGKSWFR